MQRKWSFITAILLVVLLAGCSKTEAPEITSIEQLNDRAYSVGVGEGAAGMFAVEDYLPDAEMLLYSSDVTGYAAVQQGELDAYAYDRIMMEFAIAGGLDGVRLLEGRLGDAMDIAGGYVPPLGDHGKQRNAGHSQGGASEVSFESRYNGRGTALQLL